MLKLPHPVLTPEDMVRLRATGNPDIRPADLRYSSRAAAAGPALEQALDDSSPAPSSRCRRRGDCSLLTDRDMDREHAPIPALLAGAGCTTT